VQWTDSSVACPAHVSFAFDNDYSSLIHGSADVAAFQSVVSSFITSTIGLSATRLLQINAVSSSIVVSLYVTETAVNSQPSQLALVLELRSYVVQSQFAVRFGGVVLTADPTSFTTSLTLQSASPSSSSSNSAEIGIIIACVVVGSLLIVMAAAYIIRARKLKRGLTLEAEAANKSKEDDLIKVSRVQSAFHLPSGGAAVTTSAPTTHITSAAKSSHQEGPESVQSFPVAAQPAVPSSSSSSSIKAAATLASDAESANVHANDAEISIAPAAIAAAKQPTTVTTHIEPVMANIKPVEDGKMKSIERKTSQILAGMHDSSANETDTDADIVHVNEVTLHHQPQQLQGRQSVIRDADDYDDVIDHLNARTTRHVILPVASHYDNDDYNSSEI